MYVVPDQGALRQKSIASSAEFYARLRLTSEAICAPLAAEDCVVQPAEHVSPPKWHLAHSTWFFETFLLLPYCKGYQVFHKDFNYIFNSYYEAAGKRVLRHHRGNLSRPGVDQVFAYRKYVDEAMQQWLATDAVEDTEVMALLELGFHHEMQHQELLLTDIKYILGHNPLQPVYHPESVTDRPAAATATEAMIEMKEGIYEIGHSGEGFCFDNERERHKVYLHSFAIESSLVSHAEYIAFIEDGGYSDYRHWHSDGWAWVQQHDVKAPRYMQRVDAHWMRYTLGGLIPCDDGSPVMHVNFYEASAYASWRGMRLPTEQEWEAASPHFVWGNLWEWTGSAYLPYPGYVQAKGAVGEYNGKFMVNQMVLRGASKASYPGHSRPTYRNFFQPHYQWQFSGIRLAKSI